MVLACCDEDPKDLNALIPEFPIQLLSFAIPSSHLIGISDSFKPQSESMSRMFYDAQVAYMPGGHFIPKGLSGLERFQALRENVHKRENVVTMYPPKLTKASNVTSIGVMAPYQVVGVELSNLIPNPTILEVLKSKESSKPLFYNARDSSLENFTTYGDVVNFIDGGAGDLRRLGVNPGEVVAYGAPPGKCCCVIFAVGLVTNDLTLSS